LQYFPPEKAAELEMRAVAAQSIPPYSSGWVERVVIAFAASRGGQKSLASPNPN
jgi:hypothetical protein